MITLLVIVPNNKAQSRHQYWVRRPYDWPFWRIAKNVFRVPLPSVWGLDPVRRLAASLELRNDLGTPAPATAFCEYKPTSWYRQWLRDSVEIDNRAASDGIRQFPELLGKQTPVILCGATPSTCDVVGDPQARVRRLRELIGEMRSLVIAMERRRWKSFSIEWGTSLVLIAVLERALGINESVLLCPQSICAPNVGPIDPLTISVRGMHRFLSVAVIESGRAVVVTFLNGCVYRVGAEEAFEDRNSKGVAAAAIGDRRSIVILQDKGGRKIELTPRRILSLSDPTYSEMYDPGDER